MGLPDLRLPCLVRVSSRRSSCYHAYDSLARDVIVVLLAPWGLLSSFPGKPPRAGGSDFPYSVAFFLLIRTSTSGPLPTNVFLQVPVLDESFYFIFEVSAFLRGVAVVVMETTKLIRFGPLGRVSLRPVSRYQAFLLDSHESLCDGDRQGGVYSVYPLERGFSLPEVTAGFLGRSFLSDLLALLSPTILLGRLSFLHINVFRCSSQEAVELGDRFLGQGLEEVAIQESLGEGIGFYFLRGSGYLQCSGIEPLQAKLRLSHLPTANELMQEEGTEFLKAADDAYGQLIEPLLCCPSKCGDEHSTLFRRCNDARGLRSQIVTGAPWGP
ncbi:UNVERIFIED_CONTAM: hypothetical protein Sradi_5740000 [Sesamum radiatum]|uniref:Uncharacterized protein n=1 Tax=Sesamum radiatum TaxID=300843 RepID=A0AAW2L410_SESRA